MNRTDPVALKKAGNAEGSWMQWETFLEHFGSGAVRVAALTDGAISAFSILVEPQTGHAWAPAAAVLS